MKFAGIIYNFTGIDYEDNIKKWIESQLESSVDGSESGQNLYSTDRNPTQESYQLKMRRSA